MSPFFLRFFSVVCYLIKIKSFNHGEFMKKMFMAFLVLSSVSGYASEKTFNKTMRCVRSITESRRLDLASIKELGQIIDTSLSAEAEAFNKCKSLKETTKKKEKMSRDDLGHLINYKNISETATRVLANINTEFLECNTLGVSARAVLGIGGGVGIHAGNCKSSNGRNYAVVMPAVYGSIGGGVFAMLESRRFHYSEQFGPNLDQGFEFAIGLAAIEESTNVSAIGVGLGAALTSAEGVVVKLLSVGNDFSDFRKTIAGSNAF